MGLQEPHSLQPDIRCVLQEPLRGRSLRPGLQQRGVRMGRSGLLRIQSQLRKGRTRHHSSRSVRCFRNRFRIISAELESAAARNARHKERRQRKGYDLRVAGRDD